MYLSRLILNPRNRRAQRELSQPYEMHRSIMRAFPANLKGSEERILWRVDDDPRLGVILLVQSWDAPNWSWLMEDGVQGYLLSTPDANPGVKPFQLQPASGQVLRFRLRANPTAKRYFAESGDHKRVGLYKEEEQIAWLERKAEPAGFRVLSVNLAPDDQRAGQKREDGRTHTLTLLAVRFDGLLEVTDAAKLENAVQSGIGSAKGLGFGLLSLAPPS
jgi:CRISPR system Cascade subunit CasE